MLGCRGGWVGKGSEGWSCQRESAREMLSEGVARWRINTGVDVGVNDGEARKVLGRMEVQPWVILVFHGVDEYLLMIRSKKGMKTSAWWSVRKDRHRSRRESVGKLAVGCGKSSST